MKKLCPICGHSAHGTDPCQCGCDGEIGPALRPGHKVSLYARHGCTCGKNFGSETALHSHIRQYAKASGQ